LGLFRSHNNLSLSTNVFYAFVGNIGYAGFTWLILIALTKVGSVGEVGLFAIAQAVALPVQMFYTFKLRTVQITDHASQFFAADYLGISVCSAICSAVTATCISLFIYPWEVVRLVIIISAGYGIMIIREFYLSIMQKNERMDLVALSNISNGLLCFIVFAGTYTATEKLWLALGWMAVARFVLLFLLDHRLCTFYIRDEPNLNLPYWKSKEFYQRAARLLKIGVPMGCVALMGTLFVSVPRFVLERHNGMEAVGYYAALSSVIVILNLFATSFGQVFAPVLSKHYIGDKNKFVGLFLRYLAINTLFSIACLYIVHLHGPVILSHLFKPEYASHADVFTLIVLAGGMLALFSAFNTGISAQRAFSVQFPIYALCVVVISVFAFKWVPSLSLEGAAWASVCCYATGIILCGLVFISNLNCHKDAPMSLYDEILLDYQASCKKPGGFLSVIVAMLQIAGFRASVFYRLGHRHWKKGHRIRAAVFTRLIRFSCHMDLEIAAEIKPGICFPHTWGIVIGGLCKVGSNCKIMQGVGLGGAGGKKRECGQSQPWVGENVLIGAGAKIIGPVRIGSGAQIGANAVVVKDVDENDVVIGIPARSIKKDKYILLKRREKVKSTIH